MRRGPVVAAAGQPRTPGFKSGDIKFNEISPGFVPNTYFNFTQMNVIAITATGTFRFAPLFFVSSFDFYYVDVSRMLLVLSSRSRNRQKSLLRLAGHLSRIG